MYVILQPYFCNVKYTIESILTRVCVYLCQCVFLVYCFAPMPWNGSVTMYNKVIRPVILKHQKRIDETLGKAAGAAKTALDEGLFISQHIVFFFLLHIINYISHDYSVLYH